MKKQFNKSSEPDGYEELKPEGDQERVDKAWNTGRVADKNIPNTAKNQVAKGKAEEHEVNPKKGVRNSKDKAEINAEKLKRIVARKPQAEASQL